MVSDDDLYLCPSPMPIGSDDSRHVCDSVPDYSKPFLNEYEEVFYPMTILTMRCEGCGVGLTNLRVNPRWARYIIEEEEELSL